MAMFNVGDRVISVRSVGNKKLTDVPGTVIKLSSLILVKFDRDIGGHNGGQDDDLDSRCYWWCAIYDIKLLDEPSPEPIPVPSPKYKVGDKVIVDKCNIENLVNLEGKDVVGVIECIDGSKDYPYWVYIDCPEHKGGLYCKVKCLADEQPKPTPEPTPIEQFDQYEHACWYCRKGGLVDLYLAGAMGICPSCGRVCNAPMNIKPTISVAKEAPEQPKPRKKNEPLTTDELFALAEGTKVYIVWVYDPSKGDEGGRGKVVKNMCDWGKVTIEHDEKCVRWGKTHWQWAKDNGRVFDAYLEKPSIPELEEDDELPF